LFTRGWTAWTDWTLFLESLLMEIGREVSEKGVHSVRGVHGLEALARRDSVFSVPAVVAASRKGTSAAGSIGTPA